MSQEASKPNSRTFTNVDFLDRIASERGQLVAFEAASSARISHEHATGNDNARPAAKRARSRKPDPESVAFTPCERLLYDTLIASEARVSARLAVIEAYISNLRERKQMKTVAKVQQTDRRRAKLQADAKAAIAKDPELARFRPMIRAFWENE